MNRDEDMREVEIGCDTYSVSYEKNEYWTVDCRNEDALTFDVTATSVKVTELEIEVLPLLSKEIVTKLEDLVFEQLKKEEDEI